VPRAVIMTCYLDREIGFQCVKEERGMNQLLIPLTILVHKIQLAGQRRLTSNPSDDQMYSTHTPI
jgi:hypothetical protein